MDSSKKRILITGASGFIGGFIVEEALRQGFDVTVAVRATSSRKYLADPRIAFIELDFSSPETLANALHRHASTHGAWDCVLHNAGVTKSAQQSDFMTVNYGNTRRFVDALVAQQLTPSQFVFVSTLSVFGPIHEQDGQPTRRDDARRPDSLYGQSKKRAEEYIESLSGFPYVFIRPTGVYGPRERDYFLMAESVKKHVDFRAGLRRQALTFVYVKDLVKAIFLAIDKGVSRTSYCISDGQTYSTTQFSKLIQHELGVRHVVRFACPLPLLKGISFCCEQFAKLAGKPSTLNMDKYKIMRQRNWRCDITPAVTELGYHPDYSLERGVPETIRWYKTAGWL